MPEVYKIDAASAAAALPAALSNFLIKLYSPCTREDINNHYYKLTITNYQFPNSPSPALTLRCSFLTL